MSGSVAAQAVGFALSPVISRLFSPADFGLFGSFLAVAGVLAPVATLDYSQAIILPKEQEEAGQVFLLSCLVTLLVTLACALACLAFPAPLQALFPSRGAWLPSLLVLAVLAGGLNASFQAWCVRVKAFTKTSASQLVRGLSSSGLQVGLGLAQAGAPGLVVANVAAEFLASFNLVRATRAELRALLHSVQWPRLKRLAVEYADFPFYSATQNLLNAISIGLPVLLLTHYFGIEVAGAFAFGMRLVNAPMSLVFTALRQVLFQRAGEMYHTERRLSPLFIRSTIGLLLLGAGPALLLVMWAPRLFTWVFGAQWQLAGEFAQFLVVWLLFAFCNLPAVLFARLIRIQRSLFAFNAVLLASRMATLVAGGLFLTPLQSIAVFSLVGAVMNVVLIFFVGRVLLQREAGVSLESFRDVMAGSALD